MAAFALSLSPVLFSSRQSRFRAWPALTALLRLFTRCPWTLCLSLSIYLVQWHWLRTCNTFEQDARDAEDACRKLDGFKGWVRSPPIPHVCLLAA